MEYIFGTKGGAEILKTKGDRHSDLTGYHQVEHIYPDQTIVDFFRIVEKIFTDSDVEGNFYDWYEIDHHYRTVDKSGKVAEEANRRFGETENAICELDGTTDQRMSAIEDAICELDAAVNGGGSE